jgi:hypothetical protein
MGNVDSPRCISLIEMQTIGTAVWLLPQQGSKLEKELNQSISTAAAKHNAPKFDPHITFALFPSPVHLDAIEAALEAVREQISQAVLRRGVLKRGDHFFRSVYFKFDKESCQVLLGLQARFYEKLGVVNMPPLPEFAHMSMFYGVGEETKAQVLAELSGKDLDKDAMEHAWNDPDGMCMTCLRVVDCNGLVEEWNILRTLGA